jgi:hypothetical protein
MLAFMEERLKQGIQDLSSFDKYKKEVLSGSLDWTPMHTSELFWRQSVSAFEDKDFQILRVLLKLIESSREVGGAGQGDRRGGGGGALLLGGRGGRLGLLVCTCAHGRLQGWRGSHRSSALCLPAAGWRPAPPTPTHPSYPPRPCACRCARWPWPATTWASSS